MNTKQILYNALQAQLQEKQDAYNNYIKTVFNPALEKLINEVEEDLDDTLEYDFRPFTFDGYSLKMAEKSYRNVELEVKQIYDSNYKASGLRLFIDYSIDHNVTKEDTDSINQIFLLGEVASKINEFEDLFNNKWVPKYQKLLDGKSKIKNELTEFNDALNSLQYEIKKDAEGNMKQIGFEIKKFKPYYVYWSSEKKLDKREHHITIQTGRAKYDTTSANGFKVLGKKGNKYKVEIYRDSYPTRTYDILEKKFDSFIEDVNDWENEQADKRKKEMEERKKENS